MSKNLYCKTLAIGIMIMFISIATASSTNINIVKVSGNRDYVKVSTQIGESEIINIESIGVSTLDGTVEVIDQQQSESCGWVCQFYPPYWEAQSFTPTLDTLTKIKVRMQRDWNMPGDKNLTVHIRANLTGEDLVNLSKIPDIDYLDTTWVEYDFPDLTVIPVNKYYIICESKGGVSLRCYAWAFQKNNGYKRGEAWRSNDLGATWTLEEDPPDWVSLDFCFRTYGLEKAPSKPIILGPRIVISKESSTYKFLSTDPEGDNVSYSIRWGDDNVTEWSDYQVAGEFYSESYKWAKIGKYIIEAKSKDIYGAESEWSNITVLILRPRARLRFLDMCPILQRLLSFIK